VRFEHAWGDVLNAAAQKSDSCRPRLFSIGTSDPSIRR
jgi:hypothetical protein